MSVSHRLIIAAAFIRVWPGKRLEMEPEIRLYLELNILDGSDTS